MEAPAAVGGNRLRWRQLPEHVRTAVEQAAGSPVRAEESKPGGFSPGLASVLRLADGQSVFAKAVNTARNPDTPDLHRQEARVLAALPARAPAPRLRWSYDDGDWVALLTEAVPGRLPAQPWRAPELAQFIAAAELLVDRLTPAPVPAPTVPTVQEALGRTLSGWRRLAGGERPDLADGLDPWTRRRLDRLAQWERSWPEALAGDSLLHADLRADNVLLRDGAGPVVVDWPHACTGAGWADLLFALPSVAMQGGDPEEIWRGYRPARGADPHAVTTALVAVVGYFTWQAGQPPPQSLPTVRAFQAAQARAGLAWLQRRVGWDGPPSGR